MRVRACVAPAGPFKCECLTRKLTPHAAKFVILGCEEHTLTCVLNKISKSTQIPLQMKSFPALSSGIVGISGFSGADIQVSAGVLT